MTDFTLLDEADADVRSLKDVQQRYALQYEREKTALKYYMLGKGYSQGIKALGFLERVEFNVPPEERFRKDKKTPSLHHQIRIALSVTQLKGLSDDLEELCIICALLHDIQEDRAVSSAEINELFGVIVSDNTWALTKKYAGEHKNKEAYIRDIAQERAASIVKGLDRCDNLEHMVDVFSIEKMEQYAHEAEKVFLPMIKIAMKLFPEQMHAYQAIALRMKNQIKITRYIVAFSKDATKKVNIAKSNLDVVELQNHELIHEMVITQQERDYLKGSIERSKVSAVEEKKKAFATVAAALVAQLRNNEQLTERSITAILADVTIALGLSTLELTSFAPDKYSDGTSVNIDQPFNYRPIPPKT